MKALSFVTIKTDFLKKLRLGEITKNKRGFEIEEMKLKIYNTF